MFNRKRKDILEGTGKSIACFFVAGRYYYIQINVVPGWGRSFRTPVAGSLDKMYLQKWTKHPDLFGLLKSAFVAAGIEF